ncbi:hypothetical protein DFH06DRAFT_1472964, partial [Mycena polygramma]
SPPAKQRFVLFFLLFTEARFFIALRCFTLRILARYASHFLHSRLRGPAIDNGPRHTDSRRSWDREHRNGTHLVCRAPLQCICRAPLQCRRHFYYSAKLNSDCG